MTNTFAHIAPTKTCKTPPLSIAVRTGSLEFVSGTPGYDKQGRINRDLGAQFDKPVATLEEVL